MNTGNDKENVDIMNFGMLSLLFPVIMSVLEMKMKWPRSLKKSVLQFQSIIDALKPSFQLYTSGIYDEPLCSSSSLNLDVCVAGFGVV